MPRAVLRLLANPLAGCTQIVRHSALRCNPQRAIGSTPWFVGTHRSSPAIWWCTRTRSCPSATASWAAGRCTAVASSSGDHPIINPSMNMGDAMALGRGRCREYAAEHDCGGKRNFCLAQHFCISWSNFAALAARCGQHRKCRRHHKALYEGHLSGSAEHILSSSELGTKAREPL